MREWQSQSHVRWYCRYYVVWVPKYRKRAIFGEMRRGIGRIVRELCQRQGVELVEGHALSDHVHVLLGIPPKFSASVDTSKPAISGMAAETGGVLPRGLRGTQVGLDLRAPAAWPALEDMAMMQQAIQQGGDGRGVAE